ncbi:MULTISPECIES: phage regulatory CII family protein [unclassified Ensifer]|uniref:phage regulatory CII family protein n=1 Tax=unclassified Ensifer TaxID=2633371 RepID=UPI0008132B51|nr:MULTISPECIES: phage regulatory CII family protein [unclassified Ensifer]OCP05016.1 hypothetical protein BC362_14765 [Ensifer sp. LC14]OCP11825.1 hypothetical protein BC374_16240 [Ensifer sp. LC13]OCP12381.1 hypothetical protein BBX50_16435 [Ensifer sp. LC11]OCP33651.1 hypothetical protein BC364_15405 [Ensifer sp. LC499]
MSGIRTISDEEIRTLKADTEACYKLGGGVTGFEPLTRVTTGKLSEYASFDERNKKRLIPIDVAIEADRRAKSPVIVKAMARVLGFDLVPMASQQACAAVTEADAHRVLYEATDVARAILDAFRDGNVDALDRKTIRKELREAIRALEEVDAGLDEGAAS